MPSYQVPPSPSTDKFSNHPTPSLVSEAVGHWYALRVGGFMGRSLLSLVVLDDVTAGAEGRRSVFVFPSNLANISYGYLLQGFRL